MLADCWSNMCLCLIPHTAAKLTRRQNPYKEFGNDGIALNPMEVVFVKVKGFMLDGDWAMAQTAATYARWVDSKVISCLSVQLQAVRGSGNCFVECLKAALCASIFYDITAAQYQHAHSVIHSSQSSNSIASNLNE